MNAFTDELFSLDGRIALVTGGSSGLGKRMALALARAGAKVVLVARRRALVDEALKEFGKHGCEAAAVPFDLMELEDLATLHQEASAAFGSPDILVNAAGINLREAPSDITLASWNQTITLNLSVPFFLARACVPAMRKAGIGNIINIASLQSFRAFANGMAYGASKGGIAQLTRAMAEAWSADGIVANAIAPGFFPTELTSAVFADDELTALHASRTAVGRNGQLDDLEGATVFLASRAARYITGQILPVDGGYTAK